MAYAQAVAQFLRWSEERQLTLQTIEPVAVAAYVKQLGERLATPSVKQHLAAIRMLLDWMVTGQVLRVNPAASISNLGQRPRLLRAYFRSNPGGALIQMLLEKQVSQA